MFEIEIFNGFHAFELFENVSMFFESVLKVECFFSNVLNVF